MAVGILLFAGCGSGGDAAESVRRDLARAHRDVHLPRRTGVHRAVRDRRAARGRDRGRRDGTAAHLGSGGPFALPSARRLPPRARGGGLPGARRERDGDRDGLVRLGARARSARSTPSGRAMRSSRSGPGPGRVRRTSTSTTSRSASDSGEAALVMRDGRARRQHHRTRPASVRRLAFPLGAHPAGLSAAGGSIGSMAPFAPDADQRRVLEHVSGPTLVARRVRNGQDRRPAGAVRAADRGRSRSRARRARRRFPSRARPEPATRCSRAAREGAAEPRRRHDAGTRVPRRRCSGSSSSATRRRRRPDRRRSSSRAFESCSTARTRRDGRPTVRCCRSAGSPTRSGSS